MNDSRPKPRKSRLRQITAFALLAMAVASVAGWGFVNQHARRKVLQELTDSTGLPADAQVSVGFQGITVHDVVLGDSASPDLTAGRMTIEAPLSELIRDEPQIAAVRFESPRLRLTVDENGELIFPFKSEGDPSLPSKIVEIRDGHLLIEQQGRDPFQIQGVNLTLEESGRGFKIQGTVENALGTAWAASGDATWAGDFQGDLQTDKFVLDSRELAKLPLAPQGLRNLTMTATGSAKVKLKNAKRGGFDAEVDVRDVSLHLPEQDFALSNADARMKLVNGKLIVSDLSANLADGQVQGEITLSTDTAPYDGIFRLSLTELDMTEAPRTMPIPDYVEGRVSGDLNGKFQITNSGALELSLQGNGQAVKVAVKGVSLEPTRAQIAIEQLTADADGIDTLLGHLTLSEVHAREIPLSDLLEKLEVSLGDRPEIRGSVSGCGDAVIPLQTASDWSSWKMNGRISSEGLATDEFEAKGLTASVSLSDGQLTFEALSAKLPGEADLTGRVTWPLTSDGRAEITLQARRFRPATLPKLKNSELGNLTGTLSVAADVSASIENTMTIGDWSGKLSANSNRVAWRDVPATDLKMTGQLVDGKLQVQRAVAVFIGGKLQVDGNVPIQADSKEDLVELNFTGDDLDLERLVATVAIFYPDLTSQLRKRTNDQKLNGTANVKGFFRAPRGELTNAAAWSMDVAFSTKLDALPGTEGIEATARAIIRNGVLNLQDATVRLREGGTIQATGTFPLSQNVGRAVSRLQWERVPLLTVFGLSGVDQNIRGETSGQFQVHGPEGLETRIKSISGTGRVSVTNLAIADVKVGTLGSRLSLTNGRVALDDLSSLDQPGSIQANLAIDLFQPYAFVGDLKLNNRSLSALSPRSQADRDAEHPRLMGRLSVALQGRGNLVDEPLSITGGGLIESPIVAGETLTDIRFRFANADQRSDRILLLADALGGNIRVESDLPNSSRAKTQIRIEANQVDVSQLTPLMDFSQHDLVVAGRLDAEATIVSWEDPELRSADIRLRSLEASYIGIPIENLSARLRAQRQRVEVDLSGSVLNGALKVHGEAGFDQALSFTMPLEIQLQAANLRSLANASPRYSRLRPLAGEADLDLRLKLEWPQIQITGEGRAEVRQIRWGRTQMVTSANTKLVLEERSLRLQNLSGGFARGTINGNIDWPLSGNVGKYDLSLSRVELSNLIDLANLDLVETKGTTDARLIGRIGQRIEGQGNVTMRIGTVYGVTAQSVEVPLNYSVRLSDVGGRVSFTRGRGRVANGRIAMNGHVDFGARHNVNIRATVSKLDSGSLIQSVTGKRDFDQGKLSGHLTLSGKGIRSIRDMNGRFRGHLENSQVLQFPVLNQLASFANVGSFTRSGFNSPEFELRLTKGIVSTPGIVFKSENAELFVRGSVNVNRRLDVDVALQTGNLRPDFGLADLAGSPLGELAIPGGSAAVRALDLISNRTLFLHVGGTTRSPHFQIRTDRFLREQLIRYYFPTARYARSRENGI